MYTLLSIILILILLSIFASLIKYNATEKHKLLKLNHITELLQSIYENQNEFDKDDFIEARDTECQYCLIRISSIATIRCNKYYEYNRDLKYYVTLINGENFSTNFIPERCADLINHHNY